MPTSMRAAGLMGVPATMRPQSLRSSLTMGRPPSSRSSSTPRTRGGNRPPRATGSIDLQWGGPGAPTNLMNTPSGNAAASRFSRPGAIPGYEPTPNNQRPTGGGYRGDDGIWYGQTPTSPGEIEPGQGTGLPDYTQGLPRPTPFPPSTPIGTNFTGGGAPLPGGFPRPNFGNQPSSPPLPGMTANTPPGSVPFPTATPPGSTAGYPGQNPPTGPLPGLTGPGSPSSPSNPGGMPGSTAGGPMGRPGFPWPLPGQNWPGGPNNPWPTFDQGLGGDPTVAVGGGMMQPSQVPANQVPISQGGTLDTTFYNPGFMGMGPGSYGPGNQQGNAGLRGFGGGWFF